MFRTFTVVVVSAVLLLAVQFYSSVHDQVQAKTQDEICFLNKAKGAKLTSTTTVSRQEQRPQEPEGDKHCERPNPKNPKVGATDPNKLGCTCMRKCENGKPSENYEEGKRCKVHCKPDHCDCPNPCKTQFPSSRLRAFVFLGTFVI